MVVKRSPWRGRASKNPPGSHLESCPAESAEPAAVMWKRPSVPGILAAGAVAWRAFSMDYNSAKSLLSLRCSRRTAESWNTALSSTVGTEAVGLADAAHSNWPEHRQPHPLDNDICLAMCMYVCSRRPRRIPEKRFPESGQTVSKGCHSSFLISGVWFPKRLPEKKEQSGPLLVRQALPPDCWKRLSSAFWGWERG